MKRLTTLPMPVETTSVASGADWWEITKTGIQVVGYVVTWFFVHRGWSESRKQNEDRDERKELRDQINGIASSLRNVEADVVSYLTSEGATPASYWTVFFGVRQINASVVACTPFATAEIQRALVAYRQAVTDKAAPGPTSVLPTGEKLNTALRGVSSAGVTLVRALENRYREIYPFKTTQS
jgi:hypothetical protein